MIPPRDESDNVDEQAMADGEDGNSDEECDDDHFCGWLWLQWVCMLIRVVSEDGGGRWSVGEAISCAVYF